MSDIVGFIGLGTMGGGMARNLLRRGFPLCVHDLRPEAVKTLVNDGAQAGRSIREIAEKCDRIFLCLPDTAVVESVLFGENGLASALKPGHILIDSGTTHLSFTRDASTKLREQGVILLDAPVSGMKARAEAGTLAVMVGGDEEAYQRVRPLLQAVGSTVVHLGASGNGQLAKTLNNTLFNVSCAAMAEILPVAVRLGLDPEQFCAVVSAGSGQSFGFDFFAPLVLRRDFGPGYPMTSAHKDTITVAEMAAQHGIPLPVSSAAAQTYEMALDMGLGLENKGAMVKVWEKALDIQVKGKDAP